MKKFILDIAEVIKDIWGAIAWIVQAADSIGEFLGEKCSAGKVAKLQYATAKVKRNCVIDID